MHLKAGPQTSIIIRAPPEGTYITNLFLAFQCVTKNQMSAFFQHHFTPTTLDTLGTKRQWGTQVGRESGTLTLLRYDPRDLSKKSLQIFKKGVSLHLRDFEGRGQIFLARWENSVFNLVKC